MNVEIGTVGRTIPFLGIFVLNFRYCVITVHGEHQNIGNLALEFLKNLWGLGTE
jgi:hypothetical protein